MVLHWSLSDSKSPQVSRTLLSILDDHKNAIVWMVSTFPLISKSSSPFNNPLITSPWAPIIIYYFYYSISFAGVWMIPSVLKPPIFFLRILDGLNNALISFVNPPFSLQSLSGLFWAHQLQLILSSTSRSITFSFLFFFFFFLLLWQDLSTYLSFHLLSFLRCGLLERQIPLFSRFSFFGWLSFGLVSWPGLGDQFEYHNPRELCHMKDSELYIYHMEVWSNFWVFFTISIGSPSPTSRVLSYIIFVKIRWIWLIRSSFD